MLLIQPSLQGRGAQLQSVTSRQSRQPDGVEPFLASPLL